jgi:predicted transposase YbfD/YdcC
VKESGNDVLVQVKENQAGLLEGCRVVARREKPSDVYCAQEEAARNRIERRSCRVFPPRYAFDREWREIVVEIVEIRRVRECKNTKTGKWEASQETAFYVSTARRSAEEYCRAARGHWGVENANHHVRDVSLGEDASRIRVNPAAFALLRSFALNVLRANLVKNVAERLYKNALNPDNLMKLRFLGKN